MKLSAEYQAALDYLYSYVDFSMTKGQVFTPETFDLSRMKLLLEKMINPQLNYPVVHIAGSKGKGSTAAMLASILQQAGYKVGLYTSPHLIDYCERMQINFEPIGHEEFVSLLEDNKPVIESVKQITTFEVSTALAFEYFSQEQVDIAVVEVGLGGRLDATNLVQPLLTVISSISLEHTAILGDTLELIATEKAGILKTGVPFVMAHQVPNVNAHLKNLAIERGCQVFDVEELIKAEVNQTELVHQNIAFHLKNELPELFPMNGNAININLPLVGRHQVDNASTVLVCALWLAANGFNIPLQTMIKGFENTNWPGRFELLNRVPLIIADSAHNPESMQRLVETIQEYLPAYEVNILFGASEDKNVGSMLTLLRGIAKHFIFTESVHPRAMEAAKLAEFGDKIGLSYEVCLPIENAVNSQVQQLKKNEVCIATGSIFVAAAVKEELMKIKNISQDI